MLVFCCALTSYPNDCWLIRCDVGRVSTLSTIGDLPDDDLLEIFDFCVVGHQDIVFRKLKDHDTGRKTDQEWWQSLVHVCRRWRNLVFSSPRRLNLQLFYDPRRSAWKSLDVWPALPLLIEGYVSKFTVDDVIAKLKHNDRICQIDLDLNFDSTLQYEKLWIEMQVPFAELANLYLSPKLGGLSALSYVPVLPDLFLGGFAPRLRYLNLTSIPFPGLPNLILSATHLVELCLENIPHSGYILPEVMATCLSMLTSLEILRLEFESPQSCPDPENRRSPPLTRSILPALTEFSFKGAHEYSEDLVSRINAPRLYRLSTTFFNDIDFDTEELNQFISRTPTLGTYNEAHLFFQSREALVRFQFQPETSDHRMVEVKILCEVQDWQLSFLTLICTSTLRLLITMEILYIYGYSPLNWKDDYNESTEWLHLLLPFTAVKNLYLSRLFSPRIAPALQELTEGRTMELLPALQIFYLEGFQSSKPVQKGIAQFISARQLTSRPVAISVWEGLDLLLTAVRGDRLSLTRYVYPQNSFYHSQNLPPHSLVRECVAVQRRYPDDRFDIWSRLTDSGEQVWRVKCLDCFGKVRRGLLS